MSVEHLQSAKRRRHDEFYTKAEDVQAGLAPYEQVFRGRRVYCNCDDPDRSAFVKFLQDRMMDWGITEVTASHYSDRHPVSDFRATLSEGTARRRLRGNGDFRSPEAIELLDEADIVTTNPPFSLLREYVALMMEHGKRFLIIVPLHAVTYRDIFPLIRDGVLVARDLHSSTFTMPEGGERHISALWLTNLGDPYPRKRFVPSCSFSPETHPRYDNFDAVEVRRSVLVPKDYDGVMGVPISFITRYNPRQFEIVGMARAGGGEDLSGGLWRGGEKNNPVLHGRSLFDRILIRWRRPLPPRA